MPLYLGRFSYTTDAMKALLDQPEDRSVAARELAEGDWVELDFDLPWAAGVSGLSQYELLTGLGERFERQWTD